MKKNFRRIISWLKEDVFLSLIKNSGILLIGEVIYTLVSFLIVILIVREYGNEFYGVIAIVQSYVIIMDQIVNFQSWQALIKYGQEARVNGDDALLKRYLKTGTILDLSTAVLGGLISIIVAPIVGKTFMWDLQTIVLCQVLSISIFIHFIGMPIGIIRLYNKYKQYMVIRVTGALFKLIIISIALIYGGDILIVVYAYLISDIIVNLLILALYYRVLKENDLRDFYKCKEGLDIDFVKFAVWTNISSSADLPVKKGDVLLVSNYDSLSSVGIYKVFRQITSLFSVVLNPIYQSVFPQLSKFIAKKEYKTAYKYTAKICIIIVLISLPILIGLGVTSRYWLYLVFGEEISLSWLNFVILLSFVGLDIFFTPVHPLFNALGYVREKFLIHLFSNIVFIGLGVYLGMHFGMIGIIFAYGIQVILVNILKVLYILINRTKKGYV